MSHSQYPEHLNPFAEESKQHKSGLRIGGSLRDFTKTLRKSFRIKKKEKYHDHEVEIRKRNPEALRPFPVSYPNSNSRPDQLTPALPRSRFQERLSKSPTYVPTQSSSSRPSFNPFDECEEDNEIKVGTTRRRGKKRAPLPPKSLSSQNINDSHLSLPHSSNWSLTSAADTEISYSTENVSDAGSEIDRVSMSDKFVDFNKEMAKLNDDSNNNIIIATKEKDMVIPDLVISCPNSDTESAQSKDCTMAHGEREKTEKEGNVEKETDATEREEEKETDATEKEEEKVEGEDDEEEEEESKADQRVQDENRADEKLPEEKKSAPIAVQEDEFPHIDDDSDSSEVIVVTDITCNLRNSGGTDDTILYHEKKSLYIAGSTDELNNSNNNDITYTGHVSLYITGSKEELDNSNSNEICDKTESEQNVDGTMPIPKQRKHKLTRGFLLGTQEPEIM